MCGIYGVITSDAGDVEPVLEAQLSLLRHWCRDASGVFACGHGATAQNPLAVIDLQTAAAHRPLNELSNLPGLYA
jgi:asparagine synthetase B (glutamine-hydrolysing)